MKRSSIKRRESVEQKEETDVTRRLSAFKIEEKNGWWGVFTEEILPRLPADNLEILKTVCKTLLQIISTPYFVGLHHNNVCNQGQIRVLTFPLQNSATNMTEYRYNINSKNVETKQIPFAPLICKRVSKILGSCDGLLCLFLSTPNQIGVYNPSTAKYFLVQPPVKDNNNYKCSWFGQHPSSGEYVLVLWKLNWKAEVEVYKFSGGSRFTLEPIHSTTCFMRPRGLSSSQKRLTLLHGALHWPVVGYTSPNYHQRRHVICTYNLDYNKYSEISLPGPIQGRLKQGEQGVNLGVNAEGCLFAIFKNFENAELEMWVMKEYGVEQSWAKHANIVRPYCHGVLSHLGFFPNGDLILDASNTGLIKYNFNDNNFEHIITYDDVRHVRIVCVDSLVSPTIVLSEGETNRNNLSLN